MATSDTSDRAAEAGPLDDDPGSDLRLGGLIAGAFFVVLLGAAAVIPLDAGAYAMGVTAVSGNRQAIQSRDGGIIRAIRVQEGQVVVAGQVLAEMDAGELRASERSMTSEVLTLQAQRARLIAERDRAAAVAAPPEFALLTGEDRRLAEAALALERTQFVARRQSMEAQKGVLNQRTGQLSAQISGSERQLTANREQQRLIAEELEGVRKLAAQGYAPLNRVRALERNAAALGGDEGSLRSETARSIQAIGENRMQLLSLDRQMMETLATERRDVEVRLEDLQPKLAALRAQLNRAVMRAPVSGQVIGLTVYTVGGVIQPGGTLMEIVPDARPLVVQATVSPADAYNLAVGQTVRLRFSSLNDRRTPILEGRLTKVSADGFVEETSGRRFFRIEASAPASELARIHQATDARGAIKPGLPVEVLIPLRKRTALGYLVEPLVHALWRSGREL